MGICFGYVPMKVANPLYIDVYNQMPLGLPKMENEKLMTFR